MATDLQDFNKALSGLEVLDGCDQCTVYETVHPFPRSFRVPGCCIVVHHADSCPSLAADPAPVTT